MGGCVYVWRVVQREAGVIDLADQGAGAWDPYLEGSAGCLY